MVKNEQKELTVEKVQEQPEEIKETEVDITGAQDLGGGDFVQVEKPYDVKLTAVSFIDTGLIGENARPDKETGINRKYKRLKIALTFEGDPFTKPTTIKYGGLRCYANKETGDWNQYLINTLGTQTSQSLGLMKTLTGRTDSSCSKFMEALKAKEGTMVTINGELTNNPQTKKSFLKPVVTAFLEE